MRRAQLGQDQADAGAIGGELLPQRTQVVHLVPVEFLAGPARGGSCSAPGNRGCAGPDPPRRRRRARLRAAATPASLACCSSTWMERFGIAALRWSSSQRSNAAPALGRQPIGASASTWDAGTGPASASARSTARRRRPSTDLNRSTSVGRPSSAWMRRSRSPIQRRTAALGPSSRPARNTGYATRSSRA